MNKRYELLLPFQFLSNVTCLSSIFAPRATDAIEMAVPCSWLEYPIGTSENSVLNDCQKTNSHMITLWQMLDLIMTAGMASDLQYSQMCVLRRSWVCTCAVQQTKSWINRFYRLVNISNCIHILNSSRDYQRFTWKRVKFRNFQILGTMSKFTRDRKCIVGLRVQNDYILWVAKFCSIM